MQHFDTLIVGGGHAGASAAASLRQLGYEGSVAILGAEPEAPYERPPLSKDYLSGEKAFDRLLIRPEAFWAERKIELLLGRTAERGGAVGASGHDGGWCDLQLWPSYLGNRRTASAAELRGS